MFQETLPVPAPVMNQASPAPSQGIMDTTSYPLQSHGGISFSQSQVSMHARQVLSLAKPYVHACMQSPKLESMASPVYPNCVCISNLRTMAVTWCNQWGSKDRSCSISWCSATCALSSRGKERGRENARGGVTLTIGTPYMHAKFIN
jgi:hypothetical protein